MNRKEVRANVKTILLSVALFAGIAATGLAQGYYDQNGRFLGYRNWTGNGYNYYNQNGWYQGNSQWNGRGYNYYVPEWLVLRPLWEHALLKVRHSAGFWRVQALQPSELLIKKNFWREYSEFLSSPQ